MLRKELNMLEKAYEAEIASALNKNIPHVYKTKSKYAKKLAEDGYLRFTTVCMGNVNVNGYELTELGRLTYCTGVDV